MSASAPAVPTVRVPNTVTGALSGSLNGYTVTGQPASGTVAVDADTYTYIPTAVARLRAALTTQPDYDGFPVAMTGQPATTVTVPVLPAVLSNSAMPGAAVLTNENRFDDPSDLLESSKVFTSLKFGDRVEFSLRSSFTHVELMTLTVGTCDEIALSSRSTKHSVGSESEWMDG